MLVYVRVDSGSDICRLTATTTNVLLPATGNSNINLHTAKLCFCCYWNAHTRLECCV